MQTNIDLDLKFRTAAAQGDIKTLRSLAAKVNISSEGAESKQTAAHRAAAGGHKDALMLLVNLGINLDHFAKGDKKAEEFAKNAEISQLFEQINLAKKAISAAKKFFPIMILEQSKEKLMQHSSYKKECHVLASKEANEIMDHWSKEYKKQAHEWMGAIPTQGELALWNKQFLICQTYVRKLCFLKQALLSANKIDHQICSCGEAAAAALSSFYLTKKQNDHLVELVDMIAPIGNHSVLVINRAANSDINKPETWGDALIVDPYYSRIYFIKYVQDYIENTDFKIANKLKFDAFISNEPPNLNPFPFTHKLYKDLIERLKSDIAVELAKRGITSDVLNTALRAIKSSS